MKTQPRMDTNSHECLVRPPFSCSFVFIRGCLLCLLLLAGCASPRVVIPDPTPRGPAVGEIMQVNEAGRFVVVRAAVLPEAGQEATVFAEEGVVGRIRFTSSLRPPYMAADIVEGRPRRGDLFRVDAPAAAENRSTP